MIIVVRERHSTVQDYYCSCSLARTSVLVSEVDSDWRVDKGCKTTLSVARHQGSGSGSGRHAEIF
eukprot:COSAG05_NODE_2601_length_2854_cov_1.935027_3_plen_64_part_01